MPEFTRIVVDCGPNLRSKLVETVCPACSWFAVGDRHALEIAEHAHICPTPTSKVADNPVIAQHLRRAGRRGDSHGQ
jgi:hypothetical protein